MLSFFLNLFWTQFFSLLLQYNLTLEETRVLGDKSNFLKRIVGDVQVTFNATTACFYVNIDDMLDVYVDIKTYSCCIECHLDIT